ncbi:uncharacterized protein LOC121920673 [Sceloporus undulatus]|uniref:uncharacterized protein LOC121920673 n=1 Tax=Sceloporus undulatus TaxID=8520 RepID=UPI001C4AA05D|nr:uncharacterized protein LOC121920673 [Sceloporus undulatus]
MWVTYPLRSLRMCLANPSGNLWMWLEKQPANVWLFIPLFPIILIQFGAILWLLEKIPSLIRKRKERGTQTEVPPFVQPWPIDMAEHRENRQNLLSISQALEDFKSRVQVKTREGKDSAQTLASVLQVMEDFFSRVQPYLPQIPQQEVAAGQRGGRPREQVAFNQDLAAVERPRRSQQIRVSQSQGMPAAQGLRRSPRNHRR